MLERQLELANVMLSRRRLLRWGALGLGTIGLSSLLVACADDDTDTGGTDAPDDDEETPDTDDDTDDEDDEEPDDDAARRGGALEYGVATTYIDVLDPNITAQTVAHLVMLPMFDSIVYQDNDGGFHPGLAEDWEISDDGATYTFTFQSGVMFHDGSPFNAEAAVSNFDRMVADSSASRLAGPRLSGFYESSEAVDELTFQVNLEQPNGAFLTDLSQNFMAMLSPTAVEEYGPDEIGRNPVGTGPFKFVEWVENSHITVERNEDYNWASPMFTHQGPAYLDSITFRIIPEGGARIAALETGDLNWVEQVPSLDFARLSDSGDFSTYAIPQPGIPYAFMINTSLAPTDEIEVRQAINYAVDKVGIIDTLFQGIYEPAFGPLSAATFGYTADVRDLYEFDPDRAGELLDEAGWTRDGDGIRTRDGEELVVEHYVFTTTVVAEAMQAQLEQVGIRSNVTLLEVGAVNEAATRGDTTNMAPLPFRDADPAVMCVALCIKNEGRGFAWTFHANEELDTELEEGQAATNPDDRAAHYARAQMIAMEEALLIPVYDIKGLFACAPEIQNVSFDMKGYDPWFYDLWIDQS